MNVAAPSLQLPRPFAALPWPPRIDWRRGLAQGWVVGAVPMVTDHPLMAMPTLLGPWGTAGFLAMWLVLGTGRGAILAWTAQWVEGRLAWQSIAALFVAETVVLSWMASVFSGLFDAWRTYAFNASFVMTLWLNAAYGSVFFAYCLATQRNLRVRGVLARAELERERSATALNEARLGAMAARVDPALLLRVLTAAHLAYAHGDERADALLEALVAFLRLAMPAVRSGRSTLLAELSLLRAHSELQALLGQGCGVSVVADDVADRDVAFPPLLLIPLVEAATARGCRPARVSLTECDDGLTLILDAGTADAWMDNHLAQRLDRALRDLHASPEVRCDVGASPSLTLWLPLPPTPAEVRHDTATA